MTFMQVIERHGGGSHYVRPDRVYRTGVLTSTMGYQPGQDVQDVVASFTQYPIDLQTKAPGLYGVFGALAAGTNMGFFQKLAMRYRGWKARRAVRAGLVQRGMMGLADHDFTPDAFSPNQGYAYAQVGTQISPEMVSKSDMVNYLMSGAAPMSHGQARAQAATTYEKWWNKRWNG